MTVQTQYPVPLKNGGMIIRSIIRLLRDIGVELPIQKKIWIACSGGIDSLSLAQVLIRYGRRVAAVENIGILSIDHGWRGKDSREDYLWVQAYAKKNGISFKGFKLKTQAQKGESWENHARRYRRKIFGQLTRRGDAVVLTGHHFDDLAETVLWRVFTGGIQTQHGLEGVLGNQENKIIRPLLLIPKECLEAFLMEEQLKPRVDSTNNDPKFLRNKMRQKLIPLLDNIFPRWKEHFVNDAMRRQRKNALILDSSLTTDNSSSLFQEQLAGILMRLKGMRRVHWERVAEKMNDPTFKGEIQLAQGWRVIRK